jgi:hypothetical protein
VKERPVIMEKACDKCKYLHPSLKGAKYFKCYCGDCPARKLSNAEKINGELSKDKEIRQLSQMLKEMDILRAYWKKAYLEECNKQERWVEEHQKLVRELLGISSLEEEISLENLLFDLYKQFKEQTRNILDMSPMDLYKRIQQGK